MKLSVTNRGVVTGVYVYLKACCNNSDKVIVRNGMRAFDGLSGFIEDCVVSENGDHDDLDFRRLLLYTFVEPPRYDTSFVCQRDFRGPLVTSRRNSYLLPDLTSYNATSCASSPDQMW